MMFELPTVFAITDFWMSRWLTPVWFLGVGVTAGLAVLSVLIGLFYLLAQIPGLEKLRRNGLAHIVALIGTAILTGLFSWSLGEYQRAYPESFRSDEWLLETIAASMVFGVVVWALVFCSSQRFLGELKSLLFEGVGLYMLITLGSVAALGLSSTFLVDDPRSAIRSLLVTSSVDVKKFDVPGAPADQDAPFEKIDIKYDPATLNSVTVKSNRNLMIGDGPTLADFRVPAFRVDAGVPINWNRKLGAEKSPIPLALGSDVYVQNQEIDSAEIEVRLESLPPVRESATIILTAFFVTVFGLLFMLVQAAAPKTAAIALSAAKSELSQPLPVILMMIVALAILLFVFLPFHTFGEDIKLLKDCGVTLILLAATFQAVWSASTSVNDEIEGRTALTLLSKPIHRRSFIIGKIFGIMWIVLFMFLLLGSLELVAVAYKPIYDARESSLEQPLWQQCHFEMMQTIPGLALAFFQAVVLGAFAVALGTRFSLIANFTILFSIYLLGHLTPTIVSSAEGGLPLVEFFSQLISTVVPNLSLFSMEAAIDADVGIPWSVVSAVLVYAALYGLLATLIGLLLFEDRDLA